MKGNKKEELPPNNRIIIQNLDYDTTEEKLSEYFSQYGKVLETEIPMNPKSGKSKGFGFITFSSIEEATKAISQEKHEIDGRGVRTSYAKVREREQSGGELEKGKKLYIGKLPWEVDQEELKKYFEKFGPVEDAFLPTVKYASPVNGYAVHKGFGFVTFVNEEDANKAVVAKHNLKGGVLSVRKAKPQEEGTNNKKDSKSSSSDEKKEVVVKRRGKQNSGHDQKSKKPHDKKPQKEHHENPKKTHHEKPKKEHHEAKKESSPSSQKPASTNKESSPKQEKSSTQNETKEKSSSNSNDQNKSTKPRNPKKNTSTKQQAPPKQQSPPVNTQIPAENPWSKKPAVSSGSSAESSPEPTKEFPSLAGKKKKSPQNEKETNEKGKEEKN